MYKLKLLKYIKILRVRYIFILRSADPDILIIINTLNIDSESQEKIWKVKKILNLGLINNN